MQDICYIETVDQAKALLKPERIELLQRLDEPRTCPELAEAFGGSPQKIYYHVKALEKAGLVEKVGEKRVRGAVEGFYQARARSYWLAPALAKSVGGRRLSRDQASLRFLLSLVEQVAEDVGRLGQASEAGQAVPSLALSAQVHLPDGERRAAFLIEVQAAFQDLASKYGLPAGDGGESGPGETFRLALACYPSDLPARKKRKSKETRNKGDQDE
jgi:DNA-binding transcriptional ArsR family regulator